MDNRPILSRIFISSDETRLRAGWRMLAQSAMMLSVLFVLSVLVILADLLGAPIGVTLLINQLAIFAAVTGTVPLARRFLDRRSFVSLGLHPRRALPDLAVGFLIAGTVMGAIFVFERWVGWLAIDSFAWQGRSWREVTAGLALWLAIFLLTGWQEELVARGYWLQNIAEGSNLSWGVSISSALFALAHLGNPNVSWIAIVGLFAAGWFLAYGYLRTRQLWLPIGLHIGWNFFEGNIFGFPVSGLDPRDTLRLIHVTVVGPELWTGGAFGPEAGLIVLPAMLLGAGLMYLYTLRRQEADSYSGRARPAQPNDPASGPRNSH